MGSLDNFKLSKILSFMAEKVEDGDLAIRFINEYIDTFQFNIVGYEFNKLIWAMSNIETGDIAFALWRCDQDNHDYIQRYGSKMTPPSNVSEFKDYLLIISNRLADLNL